MTWQYNANDYDPNANYEVPPVGDYRVRIEEIEQQRSKTGNDMLKLTLSISGHTSKLFHYLVFMPDRPQLTNQKLGTIFDSFGIKPGDMNMLNWRGKMGACKMKHEIYEGRTQAKISYFILKSRQDGLPAWQEPGSGKTSSPLPDKQFQSLRDDFRAEGLDENGDFTAF